MENNILEQKCPACGAPLKFDPSSGKMKCEWCESVFEIDELPQEEGPAVSAAAEAPMPEEAPRPDPELGQLSLYNCRSCGAEIIANPETAALICPYCGNNIVLADKVTGNLKPDGVVPFRITPKELPAAVRKFYKGKNLLPRGFFSDANIGTVQGVYVPFWIYDCEVSGNMTFSGQRVNSFRRGDYVITETSHYSLLRDVSMDFAGVSADASRKMDDALMDSLEPFDLGEIKPFDIKYLSGYVADRFDVEAEDVKNRANLRMLNTAYDLVSSRTTGGYLSVVPTGNDLKVNRKGLKYVLLPVYVFDLEHGGKSYPFAVNGQTGKVVGDLPTSKATSALWFLKTFGIGLGAAVLLSLLTNL